MNKKEQGFYLWLRKKIKNWANSSSGRSHRHVEYILLAPDLFHLLISLLNDPNVPIKEKAKLAGAVTYFISPIDLMPELILGPIGLLDDIAIAAFVLNSLLNQIPEEMVRYHWVGEEDILALIQRIAFGMDALLGSGLAKRIKHIYSSFR